MLNLVALLNAEAPAVARFALIATIVSALFSTSAGVALEFVTCALFVFSPVLRARIANALREPVSVALCIFLLAVLLGALHGPASWSERLSSVAGWRKALLLLLALSVFDTQASKRIILVSLISVSTITAIVSVIMAALSISVGGRGAGILIHNYATQGMVFAVGAGAALAVLLNDLKVERYPGLASIVLLAALIVQLINIAFITPGRSGYLALIVILIVVLSGMAVKSRRRLFAWSILIGAVLLLTASPHVRERVGRGLLESQVGANSEAMTSMGVRTVMWRNTAAIITEHPFLGVGTGSFQHAYQKQVQGVEGWPGTPTNDPHNQFIKVWAEQGMFGLLALIGFIATVLRQRVPSPFREFAIAIVLAWCATSLFSSHFSTFVEGRLLFFCVGAMLATPARA